MRNRRYLPFVVVLAAFITAAVSAFAQKGKKNETDSKKASLERLDAEYYFAEGEKYFILQDYATALDFFTQVAHRMPNEPAAHYKIAEVYSKSDKPEDLEKAATSIETALRLDKKNKYYYLLGSSIYESLTRYARAEEILEALFREVSGAEEHLFELAAVYQYDNKPDLAIRTYNRAEEALGINDVSSLQKQKIYLETGKVKEAIEEGEKLLSAYPDEERYFMGFAELLAQKGQRPKAIETIEQFIATHPGSGPSRLLLAGFYRDNGNDQKSKELIDKAFDDPAVDTNSKLILISTYTRDLAMRRNQKNHDDTFEKFVLSLYDRLKKAEPDNAQVRIIGGNLFMTLEQDDKAEIELAAGARRGFTSFEAWQTLLMLEARRNHIDSLIVHSEMAIELFPNNGVVHYMNGYAHLRKSNYRMAASGLELARKMSGSNSSLLAEITSLLGETYQALRDYARSDQNFNESLALQPDNATVLNNYSYFLALRKEHLDKAEAMSSKALKSEPNNTSFIDTYAWVLYTNGKYKEARKAMERAFSLPDVGAIHFEHYGDILFQLGEVNDAVRQWEKARSLSPGNIELERKIANRRPN